VPTTQAQLFADGTVTALVRDVDQDRPAARPGGLGALRVVSPCA
jgi:hypothetical protein